MIKEGSDWNSEGRKREGSVESRGMKRYMQWTVKGDRWGRGKVIRERKQEKCKQWIKGRGTCTGQ